MAAYASQVRLGTTVMDHAECDPLWSGARRRFGGLDLPAAAAGTLAAFGLLVLLAGGLAGAGIAGYQRGIANGNTLPLVGLIASVLGVLVSLLLGGWVTGRMARYDGKRNGLLTGLLFLVLSATLGSLAVKSTKGYHISDSIYLPNWVTGGSTSVKEVVTGLITAVIVLIAGLLGGAVGVRWHRNVDNVLRHAAARRPAPYPAAPASSVNSTDSDGGDVTS